MDASAIALQAGIVGGGGAGFPTHVKLSAKAGCFIVNAAECEPLIEVDKFLVRTRTEDLVRGAAEMAGAVGAARVVFAIKKAYTKEVDCLRAAINAQNAPPDISVYGMRTFYPAGDEQLISLLITGKSVPERGLPVDVGAVVDNVSTVLNFFDATQGKPVTHRVLSVTGAVREALILRVPIGTPVRMCVEAAGVETDGFSLVMGGPMMGKYYDASEMDDLVVKKTDGNILVLPPGHKLHVMAGADIRKLQNRARSSCIKCRMCTDLCPRYLSGHNVTPHVVMQNFYRVDQIADQDEFQRAFGSALNCSECGVCENYSCPMLLSPRRVNAYIKTRLAERGINPERNMRPEARPFFNDRLAPTARLTARLGLSRYTRHLGDRLMELKPSRVCLPLRQHLGAPCVPLVSEGMRVSEGDLIAAVPEGKLGANLHASMNGAVIALTNEAITLGSE